MPRSKAEECLVAALEASPLEGWDLTREFRFHPERRWAFDLAFPSQMLAVELDGQRHRTAGGHIADCEKLNEAVRLGWRVLRFPSGRVSKKKAAEWAELVRECLLFPPSFLSASEEWQPPTE
jgi:very-short-patch-repair endonuclease